MSTMEVLATGWRAARQAAKQRRTLRREQAAAHTRGRLAAAVTEHGLTLAGLACFTTAAAMIAIPLGLVIAGIGFFILELRASS
jgi:hypothetical protein